MALKMKTGGKVFFLILFLALAGGGYWKWYSSHPHTTTPGTDQGVTTDQGSSGTPNVVVPESQLALSISGSSVINDELAPALVKAYMGTQNYTDIQVITVDKKNKSIVGKLDGKLMRFDVKSPGTKEGFEALKASTADICMASAQGDPEFRGITLENVIGLDGIAIISNQSNPIPNIYKADLASIFSGTITDWSQVAGSTITGPIVLYRMGDKTGILKMFKDLVMQGKDVQGTPFDKSKEMADAVTKDPHGIGFVSYTFLANNAGIKEIPVGDIKGIPAITPNALTIASEKYPLCRRLFMYRPTTSSNTTAAGFTRFIESNAGQQIVQSVGFINLTINSDNPTQVISTDPTPYKQLINNSRKITTEFRFKTGSQDLDSRGLDDVDRLIAYLSQPQYRNKSVVLVGFTDNTGNPQANMELSHKRASSVEKILSLRGVNVKNIIGMGVLRPVRENSTETNRSFNRRVEVWIEN